MTHPRAPRLLAALVAVELAVAGAVVVHRQAHPLPGVPALVQGRPAPVLDEARVRQVAALLQARARAVLARDRAGFLAGLDPRATAMVARQSAVFDALEQVPLASWSYRVDQGRARPPAPALAGDRTAWSPRVVLSVGLRDVDADPGETPQHLTFVRRDGRELLADDGLGPGGDTPAQVWDGGPVSVVRGRSSLVLGHPQSLPQLRRLAADVDAAVPRVTAVWGPQWRQQVAVVVPADEAELGRLVPTAGTLAPFAALAVALPVRGGAARAADRVLVNPSALGQLGEVGRRVVLTHEVTHVATRGATGPLTPVWLSEGLADHVGFAGTGLPVRQVAAELAQDVQAGRLPEALPDAADFSGAAAGLSAAYQQAWLAVELLCARYGEDRVLALYRDLGAQRARAGDDAGETRDETGPLDDALRRDLGTDLPAVTAQWRDALRAQLG